MALFLPFFLVLVLLQVGASQVLGDRSAVGTVAVAILVRLVIPAFVGSYLVLGAHALFADRLAERDLSTGESLGTLRPLGLPLAQSALLAVSLTLALSFVPYLNLLDFALWGPPVVGTALAVERLSLKDAWARTAARLRGHVGRVIALLLVAALLLFAVQALLLFGGSYLRFTLSLPIGVYAIARGVLAGLTFPWIAAAGFVLYLDLRVRTESLDIEGLRRERGAASES